MIVPIQLRQPEDEPTAQFQPRAEAALQVLAERPGYRGGSLSRALDDEQAWLLLTEWDSVGAYRRALGSHQVKLIATPVLGLALDQPSAFEPLFRVAADGGQQRGRSDRAADADWAGR